jgi:stage II sporulation SpoAA-like protein
MPITMQHERDNIYRVEVGGILQKTELDRCQEQLVGEMGRIGPIRLLFVLQEFEGWERNGRWNDLWFYISYGDHIERIAIVGPERWRDETMMFAVADLRRAPVEFFDEDALTGARTWLSS